MNRFFKGLIIGLGAVAPGLSGSVLLVLFGLYRRTVTAISRLFADFKSNTRFLLPLGGGILLGILAFSRLVDYLLTAWEMPTRFAFLGLILGSVPMFFRQVRQEGFTRRDGLWVGAAFLLGLVLFGLNRGLFPVITQPNLLQCFLLGLAVAASYVVPGVDSAAILSALGLYTLWVHSLATLNFAVLLPALGGAACGVLAVSALMDRLLARWYTPTFAVIFGLFLSVIPAVVADCGPLGWNGQTALSLALAVLGFGLSFTLGRLQKPGPTGPEP